MLKRDMAMVILRWVWVLPLAGYMRIATVETNCLVAGRMCSFPFSDWRDRLTSAFVVLAAAACCAELVQYFRRHQRHTNDR